MGRVILNEASIQAKVRAYGATPVGKARIEQAIASYIEHGISTITITGDILTKAKMIEAAHKLKDVMIQAASGLPVSLQDDFQSIGFSDPVKIGPGKYQITLGFKGNITRPSLVPSRYGYVDNIIALFNNGYSYAANKRVWGEWPGYGIVGSKISRHGTHFIPQAIATFNSMYGAEYHAKAEASSEYA